MLSGVQINMCFYCCGLIYIVARTLSTSAPEKVEVFIDDKPVLVEPGTTVLQVIMEQVMLQIP